MKRIFPAVTVVSSMLVGVMASAAPLLYDFETPARTPEAGYTHVDHTTSYSGGTGFGFLDTATLDSRFRAAFPGVGGLLIDSVINLKTHNEFRVDLANGAYTVNVVGGDAQFASFQGFRVSGDGGTTWTLINRDSSTDDVDLITSGKARPFTFKYDGLVADWARVPADHDLFNVTAGQFLQGKDVPITNTAGHLLIAGSSTIADDSASYLNFVEITAVPEPASITMASCAAILLGLLHRRRRRAVV